MKHVTCNFQKQFHTSQVSPEASSTCSEESLASSHPPSNTTDTTASSSAHADGKEFQLKGEMFEKAIKLSTGKRQRSLDTADVPKKFLQPSKPRRQYSMGSVGAKRAESESDKPEYDFSTHQVSANWTDMEYDLQNDDSRQKDVVSVMNKSNSLPSPVSVNAKLGEKPKVGKEISACVDHESPNSFADNTITATKGKKSQRTRSRGETDDIASPRPMKSNTQVNTSCGKVKTTEKSRKSHMRISAVSSSGKRKQSESDVYEFSYNEEESSQYNSSSSGARAAEVMQSAQEEEPVKEKGGGKTGRKRQKAGAPTGQRKRKKVDTAADCEEVSNSLLELFLLNNNNNNNNNRTERRYSRFFTIFSQRRELSPTRMFKWPRRNCVQIACKTSSAYHVQNVVLCATWYEGTAQLDRVEIAFI